MIGSLCTGMGGLDIAVRNVFGDDLAWWSDVDAGSVVAMKHHTDAPNIGDLKTADWASLPPVRILTVGYPCQPFSNAGLRLGTDDPRHLWPWISDAIGILRPEILILENVAAHLRRGWDVVSADLTSLGYVLGWTVVRASDVGAPHRRARLFAVALAGDSPQLGRDESQAGPAKGPVRPAGRSDSAVADTSRELLDRARLGGQGWWAQHSDCGVAAADAHLDQQGGESGQQPRGATPAGSGGEAPWGEYAPAIERWESILGRIAPDPTELGRHGSRVLAPPFVEWMMGLPAGHVTDPAHGLTRNQQLKLLGNGVVPQQAEYAIRSLLHSMFREMVLR